MHRAQSAVHFFQNGQCCDDVNYRNFGIAPDILMLYNNYNILSGGNILMSKIAIGCDHGGIVLKDSVVATLKELGAEIVDFGTYDTSSVDYPVYGLKVAEAVASGECDAGVLMCGTGIGISISANKVKGIRAAVTTNTFMAEMTKRHNNANIISLGGRVITPEEAHDIVVAWYTAEYEGGRHQKRLDMIADIESKYFK